MKRFVWMSQVVFLLVVIVGGFWQCLHVSGQEKHSTLNPQFRGCGMIMPSQPWNYR